MFDREDLIYKKEAKATTKKTKNKKKKKDPLIISFNLKE